MVLIKNWHWEMKEIVHLFFYVADEGGTLDLGKGTSDIQEMILIVGTSFGIKGPMQLAYV
ncbi:hypothetical protein ACS0TY_023298 [Phlomoides rotata]